MNISPVNINNLSYSSLRKAHICDAKQNNQHHQQSNQLPNFYYSPIYFASKQKRQYSSNNVQLFETTSDFKLCQFEDIPCPACGKLLMTRNCFDKFKDELENTQNENYLDLIGQYKIYLRPIEESVYNEIIQLSNQTGIKDIRELVVLLRNSKLPQLQDIQMRKINKMYSIAKTLPKDEKKILISKIDKLSKQIRKKNSEAPFRRKIMIDRISKIKIDNPYSREKIQKLAKSFPTSTDSNSAWIVKYSGLNKKQQPYSSKEIAIRMFEYSVPNVDHILAYSTESNHDDISNYLAMHSGCNCQKSDKTVLQWFYEDKENRLKNLKAYFNKVSEIISSNKITDHKYDEYVANATGTLRNLSNNKINIPKHK